MTGFDIELALIAIFLILLFLLSLVESAIAQSSPVALRTMAEPTNGSDSALFTALLENRIQILVPLHFGIQISVVTIAILTTHLCLVTWAQLGLVVSFLAIILVSVLFRQLLPSLITQNESEKRLMQLLKFFGPIYGILRFVASPMSRILSLHRRLYEEVESNGEPEDEETTGEEIQAYLEIGEDEGILQEEDTKLIQSVVEFGNTLVGRVMTPRTKIIACQETATVGELRETMVQYRHSRIPVYRSDIDHIVGIVYIRQLLSAYVRGRESDPISSLINPVLFVPETKPVSKLLKELQERSDHAAIVIDEYGGVAGLVTIEDLVEEIVGEIHDEDETKVNKIIEEGPRTFVVRGSTELVRLEELTDRKFDDLNCSTVAGLVMGYLGRVPAPGEVFDLAGLSVRILDADRKRVHWVRIQIPENMENPKSDSDAK